jgi:hypothetical protein
MTTASELADAIGRKRMADTLEVGVTAISNAVVRGWFPSSWFLVVQALAAEAGVECPPALFKMRAHNSPSVDFDAPLQGSD